MRRDLQTPAAQAVMADRDDAIVALLEERPYTTGELGLLFQLPTGMNTILSALARTGRIRRLHDHRWAHPHGTVTATEPARDYAERDAILAQLQDGPVGVTAIATRSSYGLKAVQRRLELLLVAGEVQQVRVGRLTKWALASWRKSEVRSHKSHVDDLDAVEAKPGTRQPHRAETIGKDSPPDWWERQPQEGFTRCADAQLARMSSSKEARQIQPRTLQ
jgi:hypothetical protein